MKARKDLPEPSLRARWLGRQLRDLREERGLTLKHVADQVGVYYPVLAGLERAEHLLHRDRIAALLDLYRIYDRDDYDRLLRLAQDAWRQPEGDFHAPAPDITVVDVLWLQEQATTVRCYATTLVPDLLRTADYTAAVIRAQHTDNAERAERLIRRDQTQRLTSQQLLHGDAPPTLEVVLDEGVLHRPVGGPAVQAEQLHHLLDAGREPHIQVRVLPTWAGYQPGAEYGPFTVFDLPAPYPPVVCVPQLDRWHLDDGPPAQRYAAVYDRLAAAALDPHESAEVIIAVGKELNR